MTVICIDNIEYYPINSNLNLTIGKKYVVLYNNSNFYAIRNDMNDILHVNKERFNTISEYRNNKLNKLGI